MVQPLLAFRIWLPLIFIWGGAAQTVEPRMLNNKNAYIVLSVIEFKANLSCGIPGCIKEFVPEIVCVEGESACPRLGMMLSLS
jgi:hypothetical protein